MKKVITGSLSLLAFSLGFFLSLLVVSCAPGLEPAWTTGNSSTLCVTLGGTGDTVPSSSDARAIMGGTGLLYIQTGLSSDTAKVYGPYPASSGSSVTITDIPPGKYSEMAIFFMPSEPSRDMLPVIPDVPTADGLVSLARIKFLDAIDLGSASSVAFVKDCSITAGTRNTLQAVLIPTTNVSPGTDHIVYFNGNASGVSRRFARIDGLSSRFGNVIPGTGTIYGLTFMNQSSSQVTLSAIGLYTSDGKRILRQSLGMPLGSGSQFSWSVPWTGDDSYYLYAEFSGDSLNFTDTANASAATHSLSFVGNGGTGSIADQAAAEGLSVTLPSGGFTRPGYAFLGWSPSRYTTTPEYKGGDQYTIGTENATLYAIWKLIAKDITVTFYPNGGTGSMNPQIATEGLSCTLATNAYTLADYLFLGWSTDPSATAAQYANNAMITAGSSDLALYAIWKANTSVQSHTVTFDNNGGVGSMNPQSIVEGSAATLTANTLTRSGYAFLGWSFVANAIVPQYADGNSFAMGTADVTLFAVWAPQITVSFDPNAGTGTLRPVVGLEGKSIVLPANVFVRDGYSFLGWAHTNSATAVEVGNGALYTLCGSNETLYAVWKDITAPQISTFAIDDGAAGTIGTATHVMTMYLTEAGSGLRSITLGGDLSLFGAEVLSLNGSQLSTSYDSATKTFTLTTPVTVTGTEKLTFGFFNLTTGDAKKIITATFKDAAGNASTQVSDSIIFDTQAPTMTNFTVKDAITLSTKYATNRSVIISFTGVDATSGVSRITSIGGLATLVAPIVKVNGKEVPSTANGAEIVLTTPVVGSASFEISGVELGATGDMATGVSAKLVDLAGLSYNALTANITMDLNKPQLVDVKLMDQSSANLDMTNGDTRMDITVDDSFTGVSAIKITASGGTVNLSTASTTVGGQSYALKSITADTITCALPITGNSTLTILGSVISGVNGARVTVTVSVMDLAGNWSDQRTAFINLDLAAPVFNYATSTGVTMDAKFTDASGIQSVKYRQSSAIMPAATTTHLDATFGQMQTFTSSVPTGTVSLTGLSVLTTNYYDYIEMAVTDYVGNVTAKIYVKRTFNGSSYVCAIEQ